MYLFYPNEIFKTFYFVFMLLYVYYRNYNVITIQYWHIQNVHTLYYLKMHAENYFVKRVHSDT